MKIALLHIFILLLVCSCQKDNTDGELIDSEELKSRSEIVLNSNDYNQWLNAEENGLNRVKTIEEFEYNLLYKPVEYIICNEAKGVKLSSTEFTKRKKGLEAMQYFNFRIKIKDGQGEILKYDLSNSAEYNSRVQYAAFQMQNDIYLVQGVDTIPCELYHFERTFDVLPYCTVSLGFDNSKIKPNQAITFVYNDNLFNKGLIKFAFGEGVLYHVPKLELL